MRSIAVVVASALVLASCASQPKDTMLQLDRTNAAYATPDCVQARQAALDYNDHVAGRMGVGLALGLLGPIGLIGAVAMDANQNKERERLNEIVTRACVA